MPDKTPIYIPFSRNVESIRDGATIILQDLYAAGRADLTAPLARILLALAELDHAALKQMDEEAQS